VSFALVPWGTGFSDSFFRNVKKLVGEINFDFYVRQTDRYAESSRLISRSDREGQQ
jgi:hypothetical protein